MTKKYIKSADDMSKAKEKEITESWGAAFFDNPDFVCNIVHIFPSPDIVVGGKVVN